jgi:hypothetical protein
MARAQEITIWGCRGIGSLWLPIQSNPFCPICPSTRGNPFPSFHIPARKVVDLARTIRWGESTSRASILGSSNDNFKEDRKDAATKRLNAELLWPRSRVFVIILPEHLQLLSICSMPRAPLQCTNMQRFHRLCLLGECSHYFDALLEICLFLVTFCSMDVRSRHLCVSHE